MEYVIKFGFVCGELPKDIKSVFAYISDFHYNNCTNHERLGKELIFNKSSAPRADANDEGILPPVDAPQPWEDSDNQIFRIEGLYADNVGLELPEGHFIYGVAIQVTEDDESKILFACAKDDKPHEEDDEELYWKFPPKTLKFELLNS